MATECAHCEVSLKGKRYVLSKDLATCLKCYEYKFANKCEKCREPIGTEQKDVSYNDRHWHEFCFLCAGCQNSLCNSQFVAKENGLYCAKCNDHKFAARCDGCNNSFKHGQKKVEYNGKKYHEKCFCCLDCKQPIGQNTFVPRDGGNYLCMNCYNENFAKMCAGCNKKLGKTGINYKGKSFHKECFLCADCKHPLGDAKFTTREDKPFCQACYVKKFSKKCSECNIPISGLGKTAKFCSFGGRHWHAECFRCTKCDKNLVGKGFLMDDDDVVCSPCGNNNVY